LKQLIDFGAEKIGNKELIKLLLESFGVIFKFGGDKIRSRVVELGATEFYSE
jgi:hypothetical protein